MTKTLDMRGVQNNVHLDAELMIEDDADTSKIVQFQVSGLTSGTTRTVTIPDADGTIAYSTGSSIFTELTVDNIFLNLNTISSLSGNLNINPVSGSSVIIDSGLSIDGTIASGLTDFTAGGLQMTGNILQTDSGSNMTIRGGGVSDTVKVEGVTFLNDNITTVDSIIFSSSLGQLGNNTSQFSIGGNSSSGLSLAADAQAMADNRLVLFNTGTQSWNLFYGADSAEYLRSTYDTSTNVCTFAGKNSMTDLAFDTINNGDIKLSPHGTGNVVIDNISISDNTIQSTSGDLNITPTAGSAIVLDGTINIDAGVVTAVTSINGVEINTPEANSISLGENLESITSGLKNISIGNNGGALSSGSNCLMIGHNSGNANTSNSLIALCTDAAASVTSSSDVICIGVNSGSSGTDGISDCIFIGTNSGQNVLTIDNIGIGSNTLNSAAAAGNIGIGKNCLNVCTGGLNCAYGHASGLICTGSSNCLYGVDSGNSISSGSNNIVIGTGSDTTGATVSNTCRIGFGTTGISKSYIDGISGVTTDDNDAVAVLVSSVGQLGVTSSSRRYKEHIKTIDCIDRIMKLDPVKFCYKSDKEMTCNSLNYGLIAEDTFDIFPEMVVKKKGVIDTIQYQKLPALILALAQENHKLIQELAQSNRRLIQRNRDLISKLEEHVDCNRKFIRNEIFWLSDHERLKNLKIR